ADKLVEKTGSRQKETGISVFERITHSAYNSLPLFSIPGQILTTNLHLTEIDNLRIELEQSFSIEETKQIVANYYRTHIQQLESVKKLLMDIEQDNSAEIAKLQKDKDQEVSDLNKKLKKARKKSAELTKELKAKKEKEAKILG